MEDASSRPPRETVEILGIPVDRVSMDEALDRIDGFIASGEPHLVATADASMIVDGQSAEFGDLLRSAAMVTPDSTGVLWASRKLGSPIEAKVSGVELVDQLCRRSAERGYRIFFLGAAPGIADAAAENMRQRYPGCQIVGTHDGYFAKEQDQEIAHEVAATNPDILFVAMGIPRQEFFIRDTMSIIRARVAMGVGGSLDVHSGRAKRAPIIVQRMRMEWLWRLLQNPRKWRKTMKLPQFMAMVARQR
jgi:N-acetylglucosaminyldiphosphoundecaprenol N-acetyl-beta-D-mannosaminyltransferase